MRIFIFEYIEDLTDHYHSSGGLVVVADNELDARSLLDTHLDTEASGPTDEEWAESKSYRLTDSVYYEPKVFVFPDSGCC